MRGRADGNSDKNAHIYGRDGTCLRSFHAGDGIEDIQATEESRIWVSYFDEGVFGDTALGQAGLACLDSSGQVSFRFNDLASAGAVPFNDLASAGAVPDIADCYALNVCSNRETWLYYYTDFPLVRLVDGQVAGLWTGIGVKGSHAFAVSEKHALVAGGYGKRNRLFLVDLATSKVNERIPVDEKGQANEGFVAFGRGSRLWLQSGSALFVLDHRQLRPMARRLSIQPLAEEIAAKIIQGQRDDRLDWRGTGTVRVIPSAIFPSGSGFKQTAEGRRKWFTQAVIPLLEAIGWRHVGRCVFAKSE